MVWSSANDYAIRGRDTSPDAQRLLMTGLGLLLCHPSLFISLLASGTEKGTLKKINGSMCSCSAQRHLVTLVEQSANAGGACPHAKRA